MRFWLVAVGFSLLATAVCAEQIPWGGPRMVAADPGRNLAQYLADFRCASNPGNDDVVSCDDPVPVTSETVLTWRWTDWGAHGAPYYQVGENFLDPYGWVVIGTFSYAPFREFVAGHGDGGQLFWTDGRRALILQTQDGGVPGMQYFVGQHCAGGTGWLLADLDVGLARDSWTSEVAYLSDEADPGACPHLNAARTFWMLSDVTLPYLIDGVVQYRTRPTLISAHYDNADPAVNSTYMEEFFLVQGHGLALWVAWEGPNGTRPVSGDMVERCPVVQPGGGWRPYDCRLYTQKVAAPGGWKEGYYGWP